MSNPIHENDLEAAYEAQFAQDSDEECEECGELCTSSKECVEFQEDKAVTAAERRAEQGPGCGPGCGC